MACLTRKMLIGLFILLACARCDRAPDEPGAAAGDVVTDGQTPEPEALPQESDALLPVSTPSDLDAGRVELGRRLFHETALSGQHRRVSCASCHPLDQGGTLGAAAGGPGESLNVPTVFNVGNHFAYYWNGRAQTLESVVQSSVRSESVMDTSWNDILARLKEIPEYADLFGQSYPGEGISEAAVENALVTFLQSLATPNAVFDRWLNGGEPLPERAQQGYTLFKEFGCIRCHQGAAVGGNLYASYAGYVGEKASTSNADNGRFNVTNNEAHRYQFKVPSLRNVAVTGPYFHDGAVAQLGEAVEAMGRHQLGRTLANGEVDAIVAFLESLTGWYGERLLGATREPASP